MSVKQIEIRRAGFADAVAVSAVLHKAFAEFRSRYTPGGFSATALNTEQVLTRMQEGPVWVALREGIAVATAAAVVQEKSVHIRGMAVLPSTRRQGIAVALVRQVEEWAKVRGLVRLFLSTTPFLASAIAMYERYGFRRIDEGPHDLLGTPLFSMEKILAQR
jgi:ribosomal protein S18 acetylase RimI-like enzyme